MEILEHGWRNDMVVEMTTFFFGQGSSLVVMFLGDLEPTDKKLGFRRNSNSRLSCFIVFLSFLSLVCRTSRCFKLPSLGLKFLIGHV